MSSLFTWIKNLVCYYILMLCIFELLPKESYKKYFKIIFGAVLIILVLSPLKSISGLEQALDEKISGLSSTALAAGLDDGVEAAAQKALETRESIYSEQLYNLFLPICEGGGYSLEEVTVTLSDEQDELVLKEVQVTASDIEGDSSYERKQQLKELLTQGLGLEEVSIKLTLK